MPGDTKTRGHLGSQLERKAESVLVLLDREEDTRSMSPEQIAAITPRAYAQAIVAAQAA